MVPLVILLLQWEFVVTTTVIFFSVTWGNLNVAGCQETVENRFFIINEESQWFDQVEFGRF